MQPRGGGQAHLHGHRDVQRQAHADRQGHDHQDKKKHTKTQDIGTATFSVPPGKSTTIKLKLTGTGRALLSAAHGHLSATLTILKSSPAPSQTHTDAIHLVLHTVTKKTKK